MSKPTVNKEALVGDDHAIAYHPAAFNRDTGGDADLLWVKPGSGYVDIQTATAHELEHDCWWEYEFEPANGKLWKRNGYYQLMIHNGATTYEVVVAIPAYYID